MATTEKAYARAGVNIDSANRTKKRIGELVRSTFSPGVLANVGGFGGLFLPPWTAYREPVLVSSVDGVGTKLKLAFASGIHHTIGIDIVNHCANDILVQGARPLFFLDYLAMGRHDPLVAEAVVSGVAEGCRGIGCALLGGETAEMPDFYRAGEYDLAGCIVGIVDRAKIIDGARIQVGDSIIGLASSGLHTNGYSLARKVVLEQAGLNLGDPMGETGRSVIEELLRPHRAYIKPVFRLCEGLFVKGLVHITGGGFLDNVPRILPEGVMALIRKSSWPVQPVFRFIQQAGQIDEEEMYHVFNMGIGMLVFVEPQDLDQAMALLRREGEQAWIVGEVIAGERGVKLQ